MNIEINRHTTPPGGWVFRQPQTGWKAPTPIASTFDQTVILILQHRKGNPAIVAKHNLPITKEAIGWELENFTRARLGVKAVTVPKTRPPLSLPVSNGGAVAVAADRQTVAYGIKRAAAGTAVVLDWLTSGGAPVVQELANKRAETCVACPMNVAGSWYTVAPAEIIRATLEARGGEKLETPFDANLKSCNVCKCLNRLKVWCPLPHIIDRTKPEILAEFPPNCWIAKRDM